MNQDLAGMLERNSIHLTVAGPVEEKWHIRVGMF